MALAVIPVSSDRSRFRLNPEDRCYVENYDYDNYQVNNRSKCCTICVVNTLIVIIAMTILLTIAFLFGSSLDLSDYESYYFILIAVLIVCVCIILVVVIRSSFCRFCKGRFGHVDDPNVNGVSNV